MDWLACLEEWRNRSLWGKGIAPLLGMCTLGHNPVPNSQVCHYEAEMYEDNDGFGMPLSPLFSYYSILFGHLVRFGRNWWRHQTEILALGKKTALVNNETPDSKLVGKFIDLLMEKKNVTDSQLSRLASICSYNLGCNMYTVYYISHWYQLLQLSAREACMSKF